MTLSLSMADLFEKTYIIIFLSQSSKIKNRAQSLTVVKSYIFKANRGKKSRNKLCTTINGTYTSDGELNFNRL